MRGAAVAALLLAGPAHAETPLVSLVFGDDRLSAAAQDIQSVRRIDEAERGSALVIRLSPGFDSLMSALTRSHVGETGQLLICGETVVEPFLQLPIHQAQFVISDTDISRIDRLQAMLQGPGCDPLPES